MANEIRKSLQSFVAAVEANYHAGAPFQQCFI